jgi:Uma2 family endonuclease
MATAVSTVPPSPLVLTYEDLQGMPEDGRRYEILHGELHVTPAPSTTHQRISRNLEFALHTHVEAHGLGEVFDAPIDVILDRSTVVQPDLVSIARARLGMVRERGVSGAPDLVVEILSPATEQRDRGAKQQLYARYGVSHYWLVDGAARTVTELVLAQNAYAVHGVHHVGEPFEPAVLPGLAIDLAAVFPSALPADED